jgi:hypothetical protein
VSLQEKYMVSHFSVYNTNRPTEALTVRVALGLGKLAADGFTVRAKVRLKRLPYFVSGSCNNQAYGENSQSGIFVSE